MDIDDKQKRGPAAAAVVSPFLERPLRSLDEVRMAMQTGPGLSAGKSVDILPKKKMGGSEFTAGKTYRARQRR